MPDTVKIKRGSKPNQVLVCACPNCKADLDPDPKADDYRQTCPKCGTQISSCVIADALWITSTTKHNYYETVYASKSSVRGPCEPGSAAHS